MYVMLFARGCVVAIRARCDAVDVIVASATLRALLFVFDCGVVVFAVRYICCCIVCRAL